MYSVSVTAWSRPTVLVRRPSSLGGYPVAAMSAVRVFAAARRATHSSSDCWWLSVRCCRSDDLEQSATRHYWLCVTDVILPETENFCPLYHFHDYIFLFSGSWGFYLSHLENFSCMYVCMYVQKNQLWIRNRKRCVRNGELVRHTGASLQTVRIALVWMSRAHWLC